MDMLTVILADWLVVPIIVVAFVALLFFVPRGKKVAIYSRLLVAGLTSYLVAKLMAITYQPSTMRPFELMGTDPGASYLDNPGFPSDHTLFVWVIVFAIAYGVRKKWLTVAIAIAALAVSLGRVAALVHAPIDIIGGFIAATVGALWYVGPLLRKKQKVAKKSKVV